MNNNNPATTEIPHRIPRQPWPKPLVTHEPDIRRPISSHDIRQPCQPDHQRHASAQSTPKRQRAGSNLGSGSPLDRGGSPAKQIKTAVYRTSQTPNLDLSLSSTQQMQGHAIAGHQPRQSASWSIPPTQMTSQLLQTHSKSAVSLLRGQSANALDVRGQQEAAENLSRLRSKSAHDDPPNWKIVRQPISQTITRPQLAAEVKAIYHALVQIEAKCVNVVAQHFTLLQEKPTSPAPLRPEEWQGLIAMHRTLLHEHHDFFLASQHPSSSSELREIASKYFMPARMWKHGIHNFLELLRRHLPHSMEWMLAFIYLAYQMVALLFETVQSYEETWIECLGDLGRYRMAIEEEDPRDREIWTATARLWYCKGVDKAFHIGRLYHHLAILARSNAVEQLSLYARSLQAVQPFNSSMSSILTLLEPMSLKRSEADKPLSNEVSLVKIHANIFFASSLEVFTVTCRIYQGTLDQTIAKSGPRWRDQGCWTAICIVTAVMGWGMKSPIRDIYENAPAAPATRASPAVKEGTTPTAASIFPHESQEKSFTLASCTLQVVLARPSDINILPFIYVILIFAYSASRIEASQKYIAPWMQWDALCSLLNFILQSRNNIDKRPLDACDPHRDAQKKPIYEEYQVRGQVWAPEYLDKAFFGPASYDEDERRSEDSGTHLNRINRILHLGMGIAAAKATGHRWLHYNTSSARFYVE